MDTPLASYTFRQSALEQGRTYSLYADRLVIEGFGLPPQTYPLSDVQGVRLKYEHTKQREYYLCFIETKRGRLRLRHVSWQSFAKFEDRRATFTPFVKALLAQLARDPAVRFKAGSMVNFIGAIVGIPVMAGLAYLCLTLGRVELALVAGFMLALCVWMLGPSRPRRLDPLAPPPDLLPE
jgi:hypothetical protein